MNLSTSITVHRLDPLESGSPLEEFFTDLPTVERIEIFVDGEGSDLDIYFIDGEPLPWSVREFTIGSPTRNTIEKLMDYPAHRWGIL